jgi:hypothetical protein
MGAANTVTRTVCRVAVSQSTSQSTGWAFAGNPNTPLTAPNRAVRETAPRRSSGVADTDAPAGSVEAVAEAVLPPVVKIDIAGPGQLLDR